LLLLLASCEDYQPTAPTETTATITPICANLCHHHHEVQWYDRRRHRSYCLHAVRECWQERACNNQEIKYSNPDYYQLVPVNDPLTIIPTSFFPASLQFLFGTALTTEYMCLVQRPRPLTASNSWIYSVQEIAQATEVAVDEVVEFSPMKYCLLYRERTTLRDHGSQG
jgi:hypothetical protein